VLVAGCAAPEAEVAQAAPQTRTDQFVARYPELASGRFAVIADFEEEGHRELFHLNNGGVDAADMQVTADGVAETGGHGLTVRFDGAATRLVVNNSAARKWLMKRDWRPYTLLVMSVYSPASGVRLTTELAGGRGDRMARTDADWELRAGWNVLRLDLGEAGQMIPLDEVRALEWSITGAEQAVTLRFDDLLLTDNRVDLFGSTDGPEGALYVRHEGRRIHVGAAGRFELGFGQGQVVRWYALDQDPVRNQDLVGAGNALGPTPVRLASGGDWEREADWRWWAGAGASDHAVATQQRVVEANAVRVIVECVWSRSAAPGGPAGGELARWLYVIYPSGQVYVTVVTAAATDADGGACGLAVTRRAGETVEAELHAPGRLGDLPDLAERSFACLGGSSGQVALGFMPHDAAHAAQWRAVHSENASSYRVVAFDPESETTVQTWNALLAVGPAANCERSQWVATARAYGGIEHMELVVGALLTNSAGDAGSDGFNERFGAFMLRPADGRVQLRLRGGKAPMRSPVLSVAAGAHEEAWVYIDQTLHTPVMRDGQGNVVFQAPDHVGHDMLIEVYLRGRS